MIIQAGGICRACEKRDLHFRHQSVVDGHVGQTEAVWRPPVSDVGLQDLLCKKKEKTNKYFELQKHILDLFKI